MALLATSFLMLLAPLGSYAGAQESDDADTTEDTGETATDDAGFVTVYEVRGLLDPVMARGLERAIRDAEQQGAQALVLQLNSTQSVVSTERLNEIADLIVNSPVPVSIWVGPSGAQATGQVGQLVGLASSFRVSAGSSIGDFGPNVLDDRFGDVWGSNAELLRTTKLNWEQVLDLGLTPCDSTALAEVGRELTPEEVKVLCSGPTIGDFLVNLDGFESSVIVEDDQVRREPKTRVRFQGLSLLEEQMHTVASPPVAYLMLVIGLGLLIFEFFSVGVGVAGVIGAVLTILGAYGLTVLPFRTWALVLILLGIFAFAVDVQTAVPQFWTIVGTVLLGVGSIFLYGTDKVQMSWIPMLVAVLGMVIIMGRGMPIMIRGRFATTAIDRHYLVDQTGSVVEPLLDDETTVQLGEGLWQAEKVTLPTGTPVRVAAVGERLVSVEPV